MLKFAKKVDKVSEDIVSNWKILIVDDEVSVHEITKSVLKKFTFEDRALDFYSAYSGKEAIEILKEHEDIAMVLLDVVMESDDAGLKVAKAIRDELYNKDIRIVLRTGQPGMAPEKDIIREFDINDYREKTELTSRRLFTTVISALRSYKDIRTIRNNKIGLKKIIDASKYMFQERSLTLFMEGVLTQLVSILNLSSTHEIKAKDAFFVTYKGDEFEILATAGRYEKGDKDKILTTGITKLLYEAYDKREGFFQDNSYVCFYQSENDEVLILYVDGCAKLNDIDKNLLEIFSNNIAVAFNNICLNQEIIETQSEIIEKLGEIIESRSGETSNHVVRVADISYILAKAYGLSEDEASKLRFASPMHDVGKVAIPDAILNKPGKLTSEEFETVKTHSKIGWEILKNSKRELLQLAATVSYEHHEKWDGSGYPRGLKGEEISIEGRITAIADVFDALIHKRVYKDAWPLEKVLKLFKEESGKHFDPKLVELFFENIEEIKSVMS